MCVHNSSTHLNHTFSNTNPQPLPGPYRPFPHPLPAPAPRMPSAKSVKIPLKKKECSSVTYNAGWHMDCLPPPLTTIPAGVRKCLLCTPPTSSSQVHCDTSASPLPSLTLILTKHHFWGGGEGGKPPPRPSLFNINKLKLYSQKTLLSKVCSLNSLFCLYVGASSTCIHLIIFLSHLDLFRVLWPCLFLKGDTES